MTVDLSKANIGDICIFKDGSRRVIVSKRGSKGSGEYTLSFNYEVRGRLSIQSEWNYFQDGKWVRGSGDGNDIISCGPPGSFADRSTTSVRDDGMNFVQAYGEVICNTSLAMHRKMDTSDCCFYRMTPFNTRLEVTTDAGKTWNLLEDLPYELVLANDWEVGELETTITFRRKE